MSCVSNNEADVVLSYEVYSFYDVLSGSGVYGVAHIVSKGTRT